MHRIKLLTIAMLSAFAISAIASATASATPTAKCEPNGTKKEISMLCIQNSAGTLLVLGLPAEETIEVLSIKEPGTPSTLVSELGISIECTEATNVGKIDGLPTASAEILNLVVTFKKCTTSLSGCEVESSTGEKGTLVTNSLGATVSKTEDGDLTFKPTTGETFIEFNIVGASCGLPLNKAKVTGTVLGTLLTPETDEVTHLLDFEKAKGLLFAGFGTEFTLTEEVKLDSTFTGFAANPPWGLFLTETVS